MKKILSLSLLGVWLVAQESVTHLKLEQVSKIIDSTFNEEGVKSQGTTSVEDDAFVDNVHILQKPSSDENVPGNLIVESTVTSSGSEVHQGLTHVKSGAKLQDAKLESINEIGNLKATSGESFVSQANVVVGEDSNVTKLVNSADESLVGDGTADKFTVYQENNIKDTNIKNTTIHQGLIVIKDGSDMSNLEVTQKNSIKRSDMSGQNEINATQVTQGLIKIEDGVGRNIQQNIENEIDNLKINDSSSVNQAYLHVIGADINNLNSKQNSANSQDIVKNEINNVTMENALIEQFSIVIKQSSVDMLNNYNRESTIQQNNLIRTATIEDNSTVSQSTLHINNGSTLTNVEYFTADNPNSSQDAINEVKELRIAQNSVIYQDRLELDGAILEDSKLYRTNSIKDVEVGMESNIYQFYTQISNAKMESLKLSDKSHIKDTAINDSGVTQSMTVVK